MNKEIFTMINELAGQDPLTDSIIIFCAKYLVFILVGVAATLIGYLIYKRQWRPVIFFGANLILTFAFLLIASKLYISARPFVGNSDVTMLISHAANQSFPSDHTTVSIAIAFGLTFFTRYKFIGLLAIITACIIGFARIVAGVHYPLDILGAIGVGAAASIVVGIISTASAAKQSSMRFDPPKKFDAPKQPDVKKKSQL